MHSHACNVLHVVITYLIFLTNVNILCGLLVCFQQGNNWKGEKKSQPLISFLSVFLIRCICTKRHRPTCFDNKPFNLLIMSINEHLIWCNKGVCVWLQNMKYLCKPQFLYYKKSKVALKETKNDTGFPSCQRLTTKEGYEITDRRINH